MSWVELNQLGVDTASMCILPSDGCYETLWCAQSVFVLPGQWNIGITTREIEGWGRRVTYLECMHKLREGGFFVAEEEIRTIDVPYGILLLSDPCYIKGHQGTKLHLEEEAWPALEEHRLNAAPLRDGVVTKTGFGDGLYTLDAEVGVLSAFNRRGSVSDWTSSPAGIFRLLVTFIEEKEEE